jgi:cell division protein ZapA (FtsZ GTPase activity inhibitor)
MSDPEERPEPLGDAQKPETQVVDVEVLGRHYKIRSERPEVIAWISNLIEEQAEDIRRLSLRTALNDLDVLVRVAFRLGLSLYHSRRELSDLKDSVKTTEDRIEVLSQAIEGLFSTPREIDGKIDGEIDGKTIDDKIDDKIDDEIDRKIDGEIDEKIDGDDDA